MHIMTQIKIMISKVLRQALILSQFAFITKHLTKITTHNLHLSTNYLEGEVNPYNFKSTHH